MCLARELLFCYSCSSNAKRQIATIKNCAFNRASGVDAILIITFFRGFAGFFNMWIVSRGGVGRYFLLRKKYNAGRRLGES